MPDVWAGSYAQDINGNPDKSRIRLRSNSIAARDRSATMSLIIADRNLSPPAAFLAPHFQTRPGAGRWMPHGIAINSANVLHYGRGYEKLYAHPSRCFTLSARPKCVSCLRKVGRGWSLARKTSRGLRLRRGTVCAGVWRSDLDLLLLTKITRGLRH
jgi:hypothetical protein